jgi:hypothetical protein
MMAEKSRSQGLRLDLVRKTIVHDVSLPLRRILKYDIDRMACGKVGSIYRA